MKSLKFIIQEMKIDDINDIKILTKTCFQFSMKTCYQWAKEHPIISSVLLCFYLLYIFYPFVFSILFYTFPLAICVAISLEEPQFISEKHFYNTKKKDPNNVTNTTRNLCDFTSIDGDNKNRRTYLQTHMSRRTFGRLDNKISNNNDDNNNNNILPNIIEGKTQIISTRVTPPSGSPNSTDSQSEEDSTNDQEKNKNVVEWTEYDEKNLMNLGSSEIERNKRLESLIAKRRARKMYTMQPRRPNFYLFDQHDQLIDHQVLGSIFVSNEGIEFKNYGDHQQPGSAPSVLLPTRNPFDIPYDPHEEKPILTGGSFDEEFYLDEQHRDLFKDHFKLCNNNSNSYEISKMGEYNKGDLVFPKFFTKPRVVSNNNTGSTRFRRESDAEERLKEVIEELSMRKENGQAKEQHKESLHEVQPKSDAKHDGDQQTFDNPFAIYNKIVSSDHFLSLPEWNKETKLTTDDKERNICNMKSETISSCTRDDHPQSTQDHVVLSDYKGQIDDDDEEGSSSSSSPSSTSSSSSFDERTRLDATKNEAFRNSVRKVLTCLAAFPRNNKDYLLHSSEIQDLLTCNNTNTPTNNVPTPSKMQERSFYTEPRLHKSNFSIASDMQVEVSEGGSPPMTANEANSPTDQGSYDGDVDKDVNSIDDEELWGVSPNPTKRGEFGVNFKIKDNSDEDEKVHKTSNLCNVNVHDNENDNDPSPTLSLSRVEEEGGIDQHDTLVGVVSSFSPRSILHNEGSKNKVIDVQSTNGDIMESKSSSSSEELTSQMQNKVDHLANYLANLPPSDCGSNFLEDVEHISNVRDPSKDETYHNEIKKIFEFDENKEDSKEGSQRSSEESSTTSPIHQQPKETNLTSNNNEFHGYDLNKEHVDQASSTTEQSDYIKTIEDEGGPLACEANENEVMNSMSKPKESISDSNSTTCQEDFLDQLRLEDNTKITPLNQVQDEREDETLSNQSDADSIFSREC